MKGLDRGPILVTGAAGSIGSAIVSQLCGLEATVIASDIGEDQLANIAEETGCRKLAFDLTSEASVRTALEGEELWGVVNCAGFGGAVETPMEADVEIFDKAISINARGTFLVTKYASQSMIRHDKGGAIVNISSQAALIALDGHISYAASKAAVDSCLTSAPMGQFRSV